MKALIFAAGAALALSACGDKDNTETTTVNTTTDANMMATDNTMMTTDGNTVAVDPATQNMIQEDLNTNDKDTNLANGM